MDLKRLQNKWLNLQSNFKKAPSNIHLKRVRTFRNQQRSCGSRLPLALSTVNKVCRVEVRNWRSNLMMLGWPLQWSPLANNWTRVISILRLPPCKAFNSWIRLWMRTQHLSLRKIKQRKDLHIWVLQFLHFGAGAQKRKIQNLLLQRKNHKKNRLISLSHLPMSNKSPSLLKWQRSQMLKKRPLKKLDRKQRRSSRCP